MEHSYRRHSAATFLAETLFDKMQALKSYGDIAIWTLLLPLLITRYRIFTTRWGYFDDARLSVCVRQW